MSCKFTVKSEKFMVMASLGNRNYSLFTKNFSLTFRV